MPKTSVTDWSPNPDLNGDIDGLNIAEQCPPSGINNAIRSVMAQVAALIGGGGALALDIFLGTALNKFLTPKSIYDAAAFVPLTYATTIPVDFATGINFGVTLTGNATLAAPTNVKSGSGFIEVVQDATGGRALTFDPAWDFGAAGAPLLSAQPGKATLLSYAIRAPGKIRIGIAGKGFAG